MSKFVAEIINFILKIVPIIYISIFFMLRESCCFFKKISRTASIIKLPSIFCFALLVCLQCFAEMTPVPGIEPLKDYPILYVNTVDSTPVNQKEEYIDAKAWLIDSENGSTPAVGSEESPVDLGIRGRGNASWLAEGPKPYKIKFEKKQSFFGLTKNKHWVLLPVTSYGEVYNNFVGFEIGRQLGMPYLPQRYPVQLVLNGVFVGFYMLGENIRIDEGRVDIFEQPDNNEDEATVPDGWLVEVDNYSDPCQIRVPRYNSPGLYTRISYHTPEALSAQQEDWLYRQFDGLAAAVCNTNRLDRGWEEYVDVDDLAKYFVTQEIIHNFDAYVGSWYFHKDANDPKWHAGPLWDLGWSLDRSISSLLCELEDRKNNTQFMDEIVQFPRFLKRVNEVLEKYAETNPGEWVDSFCDSLFTVVDKGLEVQSQIWTEFGSKLKNQNAFAKRYFKENLEYLLSRFSTDLKTHGVTIELNKEDEDWYLEEDADPEHDARVLTDGLALDEFDVKDGQSVTLTFESVTRREIKSLIINEVNFTDSITDNAFILKDISDDLAVSVTFGPRTYIPLRSLAINPDSVEILPGQTVVLAPAVNPESATLNQPVWLSDDETIAAVDSVGTVVALTPGITNVRLQAEGMEASCAVTVLEPGLDYGDSDANVFERVYIFPDKISSLNCYVDSLDISYWHSENEDIVTTLEDGSIYSGQYGECVLRAKDSFDRTVAYFDIFSCPSVFVEHGNGLIYNHPVLYNSRPTVYLGAGSGFRVAGITQDGEPVDEALITEDGYFTTQAPVTADTRFNIALEEYNATDTDDPVANSREIRLYVDGRTLTIRGIEPDENVNVVDTTGKVMFSQKGTTIHFDFPGIYIVTIEDEPLPYKILIK